MDDHGRKAVEIYKTKNCQNETLKKIHWIKLVKNSKLDVINVSLLLKSLINQKKIDKGSKKNLINI